MKERAHVGDERRELDDVGEVGVGSGEGAAHVGEGLSALGEKITLADDPPVSIERDLAGDVNRSPGPCHHDLRVPRRRRKIGGIQEPQLALWLSCCHGIGCTRVTTAR
jgi:hypothetical protein